jgi:hypothetical protein
MIRQGPIKVIKYAHFSVNTNRTDEKSIINTKKTKRCLLYFVEKIQYLSRVYFDMLLEVWNEINVIINNMLPKLDSRTRNMQCVEASLSFSNNSSFIYQGNVDSVQKLQIKLQNKTKFNWICC